MNALWYNQLDASLHLRLPDTKEIQILSRPDERGGRKVWMSTSDLELATLSDSLEECAGHVLVAGLGLGIFPTLAAQKHDVQSVTVVEIDPDIVAISAPYIAHPKVTVVTSAIEEFAARPPPDSPAFDYCFYDTWPNIQDPYAEQQQARRTVAALMAEDGTVSLWCQALNDRKLASMDRIRRQGAGAVGSAAPGTTCYGCADLLTSSIAGLCVECALGTWKESAHLAGRGFPISPDDIPEIAVMRAAHRALVAIDPEVISAARTRITA